MNYTVLELFFTPLLVVLEVYNCNLLYLPTNYFKNPKTFITYTLRIEYVTCHKWRSTEKGESIPITKDIL